MATRGTYKSGKYLMYNHCDNYPEGAAAHLIGVIRQHGNLDPFSIIRGMPKAEAIDIFDCGQDYHYEIKGDRVKCYEVLRGELKMVSSGEIAEWLTTTVKPALEPEDDATDYQVIKTRYRYHTRRSAFNEGLHLLNKAQEFTEQNPNRGYLEEQAFDLFAASELWYDISTIDSEPYRWAVRNKLKELAASLNPA